MSISAGVVVAIDVARKATMAEVNVSGFRLGFESSIFEVVRVQWFTLVIASIAGACEIFTAVGK